METSRLARAVALAAVAAAVIGPATADAATRYVKQGGLNSGSCLTAGTACSYSRALNAGGPSVAGDTVMVESGSYNVNAAEVLVTKRLDVVGYGAGPRPVFTGTDPNVATFKVDPGGAGTTLTNLDIRAEGNSGTALWAQVAITGRQLALSSKATCAYLNAPGSTLEDTSASATSSGSACITGTQGNTTLRNVDVIQNNAAGTGVYFGAPGSSAEDLLVMSAGQGALIANHPAGPALTVRRSLISAAGYNGLVTAGGPVVITDSFLRSAGSGGAALSVASGDAQLRNVTAIASGSNSHALRIESAPPGSQGNLTARNVIARGIYAGIVIQPGKPDPLCIAMPPGTCIYPDHVPGTAGRSHSNVGSALGGVQDLGNNKTGPPGFINAAAGDYRLAPGSTSIDAGTADSLNGPLDYYGLPRTLGAAPDIGAFEFDPGAPPGDPPPGPMPPGDTVPEDGAGSGGGGASGVAPDTAAPLLAGARVTNRVFARTGDATAVNARAKRGTAFRYQLSEASVVTITIQRRVAGRRKGRRCVKPTRKLARAKRCNRYVTAGTLTRAGAPGDVSVPFSGRIGRRALPLGTFRATLRAKDMANNRSLPAQVVFRIVRR
jgi:hypothetical protein